MQYKYRLSTLGGTFDRFHIGHKKLIDAAFSKSEKVTIGIATAKLYNKKPRSHIIEDYQARENALKNYLSASNLIHRATLTQIDDVYGITLEPCEIEAIFVTEYTLSNAQAINVKRSEIDLAPLAIEKVDFVLSDDQKPVSSGRIRNGEIDREGNSYIELFLNKKRRILPDELRDNFEKPFGKVIKDLSEINKFLDERNMLFAVGDIVVINLFKKKIIADIDIIDFKTRRLNVNEKDRKLLELISEKGNVLRTENAPGTIERRAVGIIRKAFENIYQAKRQQMIIVEGEEDLLTLPIIALAPLDSLVIYGQPDRGIVIVKVTEKKKKEVKYLLSKIR